MASKTFDEMNQPNASESQKENKAQLRRLIRDSNGVLCGGGKPKERTHALNALLLGGHDLKILDDQDIQNVCQCIFYGLWYSEMGRDCEPMIATVQRACWTDFRLTRSCFQIIAAKWYGLDQYQVDKISHLARHLLPALLKHQIGMWLKRSRYGKNIGTASVKCPKLLKQVFNDIVKSYGLCYFLLEILAQEVSASLARYNDKFNMIIGRYELKANLIMFLYRQVIDFGTNVDLDARLIRTFDQYVFKTFIEDIIANESQLTQILITLRFYQTLEKRAKRSKPKEVSAKLHGSCRALLQRWSRIFRDTHEACINSEYFTPSELPANDSFKMTPEY